MVLIGSGKVPTTVILPATRLRVSVKNHEGQGRATTVASSMGQEASLWTKARADGETRSDKDKIRSMDQDKNWCILVMYYLYLYFVQCYTNSSKIQSNILIAKYCFC